jgi:hypothetical protein
MSDSRWYALRNRIQQSNTYVWQKDYLLRFLTEIITSGMYADALSVKLSEDYDNCFEFIHNDTMYIIFPDSDSRNVALHKFFTSNIELFDAEFITQFTRGELSCQAIDAIRSIDSARDDLNNLVIATGCHISKCMVQGAGAAYYMSQYDDTVEILHTFGEFDAYCYRID